MDDMTKTHYKKLVNPDFLGAYSLTPDEDLTVEIIKASRELVTVSGGKKEDLIVASLVNQKPLILNKTNLKTIAKIYGPYIEDWAGKRITLYGTTTRFGSDTVECLRVRPTVTDQEKPKPTISKERFNKAIKSIESGDYTKAKVLANFNLTPEQTKILNGTAEGVKSEVKDEETTN